MVQLKARISKRIKMTSEAFQKDCQFSKKLAFLRMGDELSNRAHLNTISNKLHKKKDEWIINYLETLLEPVIEKYQKADLCGEYTENAPIWVCWWTGEDSAPQLVKQCIKSIRKNAGNHPVYFISKDTYGTYVKIPDYMLKKSEVGEIGLAHLADYVRVALLAQYGGLWLDSTIFVTQEIPEDYFRIPLFTCKSIRRDSRFISKFEWVTFCLGGWKNQIFYQFLKEAFECYWKNTGTAIDYLFFDYLIFIARKNIPVVKKQLENLPINNLHRDDLQAAMNEALPAEQFENVLNHDTMLYKLSWREQYALTTASGEKSIYSKFLNLKI